MKRRVVIALALALFMTAGPVLPCAAARGAAKERRPAPERLAALTVRGVPGHAPPHVTKPPAPFEE